MKRNSKILCAALSCLMVSNMMLPVSAQDEVEKKESVYTVLNTDGSIKSITVSDNLHSEGGFKDYQDKSNLKDVVNLKSNDSVVSNSNGYVWNSDEKDIYYQGTSKEELPLTFKITYKLDGSEYKAEDLLGKSGHLTISIKVNNSSKQSYYVKGRTYNLATPFVTGLTAMFDEDSFKNVTVDNGTVTSDSSHSVVVGVMVPGLRNGLTQVLDADLIHKLDDFLIDDITIEADVTDYVSPTIMMAAATSSDAIKDEFSDVDGVSSIFDKLDDLKEATNELIDGSDSLYDGTVKLNDGVGTLKDGAKKLSDGANDLYKGATDLSNGASTLYAGLNTLSSNSSAIADGVKQVADGILSTVNQGLVAQGLGEVNWDNYSDKFAEYLNVSDAQIESAKKTIMASANVDEATVNVLIYMAATDTSDKAFEDKIASAGATLVKANTIKNSSAFIDANTIGLEDARVQQVLIAIKTQMANSPSCEGLDTVYAGVVAKVAGATGVNETKAGIILAYACENPVSEDVLGAANITNAATNVMGGSMPSGASDPRNDEAVVRVLKGVYASTVMATDNASVYEAIINTLVSSGVDEASAPLVFNYGVTSHEGYDATKDTPTAFFSENSNDLAFLSNVQTIIAKANSEDGQKLVKATLSEAVSKKTDAALTPVLTQLNQINALVQGVKTYTDGVNSACVGAKALAEGALKLNGGTKSLKDGVDTLNSGVNDLKEGSNKLADGAKSLKEGMIKYNDEGISKLTESSRITSLENAYDLLETMPNDKNNYNNYSGISDDAEGSIKFVFKVETPKKAKTVNDEAVVAEKTTFWQRVVNLFKF